MSINLSYWLPLFAIAFFTTHCAETQTQPIDLLKEDSAKSIQVFPTTFILSHNHQRIPATIVYRAKDTIEARDTVQTLDPLLSSMHAPVMEDYVIKCPNEQILRLSLTDSSTLYLFAGSSVRFDKEGCSELEIKGVANLIQPPNRTQKIVTDGMVIKCTGANVTVADYGSDQPAIKVHVSAGTATIRTPHFTKEMKADECLCWTKKGAMLECDCTDAPLNEWTTDMRLLPTDKNLPELYATMVEHWYDFKFSFDGVSFEGMEGSVPLSASLSNFLKVMHANYRFKEKIIDRKIIVSYN